MNWLQRLIFTSVLTLSASLSTTLATAASDTPPEETLPSPYFVDDVHCEGIRTHNIEANWLVSESAIGPARDLDKRTICQSILRSFGIEKFMWLSPEDLEGTATVIKQSKFFSEADLSIQKSELKNHVHVFLKVKPAARFHKTFDNQFHYYSAKSQKSPRMSNDLHLELEDRGFGPTTVNKYGVRLYHTSAASALTVDPTAVTSDDAQKLTKKTAHILDLNWETDHALTEHWHAQLDLHLLTDNVYSDNRTRGSYTIAPSLVYSGQVNVLNGRFYFGPSVLITSTTPYQATANTNPVGDFLLGFKAGYIYGRDFASNLKFASSFYGSAATDQSIWEVDFSGQFRISSFDTFLLAGLKEREARLGLLPQDRIQLIGTENAKIFLGLAKVFVRNQSKHQISLLGGTDHVQYASEKPSYAKDAEFVGVEYKASLVDWDVKLGANYNFQRNF